MAGGQTLDETVGAAGRSKDLPAVVIQRHRLEPLRPAINAQSDHEFMWRARSKTSGFSSSTQRPTSSIVLRSQLRSPAINASTLAWRGLVTRVDTVTIQDVDGAGGQGVELHDVERSESPLHAQAREHWPFMASRWQEVPGLAGVW